MSTSNSYNYSIDRNTLITTSFELIGVGVEGEALQAEDITVASRALNMMLKAFVVHGLQVWKRKTLSINPLVLSKQYYDLGTHQTDSVTATGDGTTTVTITHAYHGYKTGDSVLIAGATGDTDINGTFDITVTSPSAYTYTALAAVDSGAEAGTVTATLQSSVVVPRPERILSVDRLDSSSNETSLYRMSRDEYDNLANKTTAGTPSNYHYERSLGAGRLYIWPVADATSVSDYTINITYQSQIEDMDASTDDFDFPPEWLEPIAYQLAVRLAPRYGGLSLEERSMLKRDADKMLEDVSAYDVEDASTYLSPERTD